jgi:type IV pilus assembly protein PilP
MLLMASMVLVGCSGSEHGDLRGFVDEVKSRPAGRIAPLPEFEVYESYAYSSAEERDPFAPRASAHLAGSGGAGGSDLEPDLNRYKEALEQFPLDGLEFAGILENQDQTWAIIKAPDGLVHRVQVGNHLGQNYGKIVRVSETKVEIEEIIPDGLGGWIKRDAALAITE